MTKSELVELGTNNGIEGLDNRMLKADLIDAVREGLE